MKIDCHGHVSVWNAPFASLTVMETVSALGSYWKNRVPIGGPSKPPPSADSCSHDVTSLSNLCTVSSSRSHAFCVLRLHAVGEATAAAASDAAASEQTGGAALAACPAGSLLIVDLAGSF